MQIQTNQNYSNTKQNPQFKSVYRVKYWVIDSTQKCAPTLTRQYDRDICTKLVRQITANIFEKYNSIINELTKRGITDNLETVFKNLESYKLPKSLCEKIRKAQLIARIQRFMANRDADFKDTHVCRSFCIENESFGIKPQTFFYTGNDAQIFESTYGKPIGVSKRNANTRYGSAEHERAKSDYWTKGYSFLAQRCKQKDLNIKVETIRDKKTGDIKDYKVVDMEFFPTNSPDRESLINAWLEKECI